MSKTKLGLVLLLSLLIVVALEARDPQFHQQQLAHK